MSSLLVRATANQREREHCLTAETRRFFSWVVDNLASTWDSKSVGAGRLINGGNRMLFPGMINGSNTTLLHLAGWWFGWTTGQTCSGELAGAGGLLRYRDTTLLLTWPQDGQTDVQQRQDWVWCGGVFWVVGGNTGHALGVTEKNLTHAEINIICTQKYIINIHWQVQWMELLGITKPIVIENSKLYHFMQFFFSTQGQRSLIQIFCYTWQKILFLR